MVLCSNRQKDTPLLREIRRLIHTNHSKIRAVLQEKVTALVFSDQLEADLTVPSGVCIFGGNNRNSRAGFWRLFDQRKLMSRWKCPKYTVGQR